MSRPAPTPLVRLAELDRLAGAPVLVKCEFANPTGSVKDRMAGHIIGRAIERGLVTPGRTTLVEATAGNTGLALAAVAQRIGCPLVVTMSEKMGPDKARQLRSAGAEVVICPAGLPPDDPRTFLEVARRLAAERPDHFYVDQFGTPWNVEAHRTTTGPELHGQAGPFDVLVAGVGTGGTAMGILAHEAELGHRPAFVLADPVGSILGRLAQGERAPVAAPYLAEGIGGDFLPPLLALERIDHVVPISAAEMVAMCLLLAEREGLAVGGSSGCAAVAAVRHLRRIDGRSGRRGRRGRTGPPPQVVVVFPDGGDRYASTIYDDRWRRGQGLDTAVTACLEAWR